MSGQASAEHPPAGEATGASSTRGRAAERVTAGLAVALAIAALVHARAFAFLCDDAFISFRYARHLARSGALEYNLGERVEGYTNLLWVLLLALGDAVGLAPEALAPWLTGAASLVGIAVAVLLLRRLRGRAGGPWAPLDLAPALLLAAAPEWVVWASGGLETSLAAALTLAAMLAWSSRRLVLAAGLAGLAGLTRADALVPIAAFGVAWLALAVGQIWHKGQVTLPWGPRPPLATWREGQAQIPWRRLAAAALVFAALIGGQLIFRRLYYGAFAPNTWTVKAHGALLRGTWGAAYVTAWAQGLGLVVAAPLLVLARARHLIVALPIAAALLYAYAVGGDFMAYSRFLIVPTALCAILCAWLLGDAADRLRPRWPRLGALPFAVAGIAALALAAQAHRRWEADRARPEGWLDHRWEGVTAMDHFARVRLDVGAWMRENLPEGTWITVGAAGALPYASGLPAIDAYGLVDPALATLPGLTPRTGAGARPGHQLIAPTSYLRGRDPDLYCHAGVVAERRPPPAGAGRRGLGHDLVWACIERTGGDGGRYFYCCLRRRDRVVGPFGGG